MADIINEALLEMYFLQALVDYYSKQYGVKYLRLLKPSTQKEVWVGFDQGWVNTSVDTDELYNELKEAIKTKNNTAKSLYLGFFLQFKMVHKITRKSKLMPNGYNTPYYRSELSLKPNDKTRLSQHETLLRLNTLKNANVFYACGMLFNIDDVYSKPDIADLRLIPVSSAPNGWNTNERHFITFQTKYDNNPLWCSEPVKGISYSVEQWLAPNSDYGPKMLEAKQVLDLIRNTDQAIHKQLKIDSNIEQIELFNKDKYENLPESMTIIEFKREN